MTSLEITCTLKCYEKLFANTTGTAYDIKALSLDKVRYDNVLRSSFGLDSTMMSELHCGLRLSGHSGKVRAAEMDPTGTILASASEDFSIALWKIKTRADKPVVTSGLRPGEVINRSNQVQSASNTVCEHNGHVVSLSFTDLFDKKKCYLASCSSDHSLIVWNVRYGGMLKSAGLSMKWICPSAHLSVVSDVCWGHEHTKDWLFTAGWDHNISVWKLDMPTNSTKEVSAPLRTLWGHTARVACVAVTRNGNSLVSAGADCCAILWDLSEKNLDRISALCKYPTDSPITAMTAGLDTFVTGEMNGVIRVWNTMKPKKLDDDNISFELNETDDREEKIDG